MSRLNVGLPQYYLQHVTYEGAPAKFITPEQQLQRSVLACLLWENEFYEDGKTIAERIADGVKHVSPEFVSQLAISARQQHNLRHAPLWLTRALIREARGNPIVAKTIEQVVERADELGELLTMYWQDREGGLAGRKRKIAAQLKKGLARAFTKFDAYQLAKYSRDTAVKLKDVLFLVHPKPKDEAQAAIWKQLVDGTLPSPDTWEVSLSAGADKKEAFTRLLQEKKLGYLALLRNLHNMSEAGVDTSLVRDAIVARKGGAQRVLPFRYVAAARVAPQFAPYLDQALSEAIAEQPIMPGETAVLVDVSGSMNEKLSAKSNLQRCDAAAALASLIHGNRRVFSFSDSFVEVKPYYGMAGVDMILHSQPHSGTRLGAAVTKVNEIMDYDRIIVVTDEQSHDCVPDPKGKGYMINIASYKNGIGYGKWIHLDGFSESIIKYIVAAENQNAVQG